MSRPRVHCRLRTGPRPIRMPVRVIVEGAVRRRAISRTPCPPAQNALSPPAQRTTGTAPHPGLRGRRKMRRGHAAGLPEPPGSHRRRYSGIHRRVFAFAASAPGQTADLQVAARPDELAGSEAATEIGVVSGAMLLSPLALDWWGSDHADIDLRHRDGCQPRDRPCGGPETGRRGGRVPLGRLGTPEEIAALICLPLSDDAGFVTGQTVNPNGTLMGRGPCGARRRC